MLIVTHKNDTIQNNITLLQNYGRHSHSNSSNLIIVMAVVVMVAEHGCSTMVSVTVWYYLIINNATISVWDIKVSGFQEINNLLSV